VPGPLDDVDAIVARLPRSTISRSTSDGARTRQTAAVATGVDSAGSGEGSDTRDPGFSKGLGCHSSCDCGLGGTDGESAQG